MSLLTDATQAGVMNEIYYYYSEIAFWPPVRPVCGELGGAKRCPLNLLCTCFERLWGQQTESPELTDGSSGSNRRRIPNSQMVALGATDGESRTHRW
jgi:hypothetical protein